MEKQLLQCENGECNHLHFEENRIEPPADGTTPTKCPICKHGTYYEVKDLSDIVWWSLHEKWSDNLKLYYVQANNWEHDKYSRQILIALEFSFNFYGHDYMVCVTMKNIKNNHATLGMVEGDGILMDSFTELLEGDMWDKLKNTAELFEKYHNDEQNEARKEEMKEVQQ